MGSRGCAPGGSLEFLVCAGMCDLFAVGVISVDVKRMGLCVVEKGSWKLAR